ncbi:RTC4 [Candida jiufengensis]|uniref:RTC4 n=1 Tax=Candida jiufengensis TaxID=497108 RepID=UPI002224DD6A|nr:RTC4 [Candida jiufengensis]KAI5956508.1 RTC4 [Candida jiufengensis]
MSSKQYPSLRPNAGRRTLGSSPSAPVIISAPKDETGLLPYSTRKASDNVLMNSLSSSPFKDIEKPQYSTKRKQEKEKKKKEKVILIHNTNGGWTPSPKKKKRSILDSSSPLKQDSNPLERNTFPNFPINVKDNDSDDDNDDGFGTVSIQDIKKSPKKTPEKSVSEINLDLTDDEDDDIFKTVKVNKNKPKKPSKSQDANIEPVNLIHEFELKKYGTKKDILRKHKHLNIPHSIRSRKKLLKRASRYYKVIPEILAGKIDPSIYYERAKRESEKSNHDTMIAKDKLKINWESFYGGYYGFQRQSIIGSDIFKKFESSLKKSSSSNNTVKYWSPSSFAIHVLANEIIIRLIIEDLKCNFEKAEEVCQETTDYGIIIADQIEIENDLAFDDN